MLYGAPKKYLIKVIKRRYIKKSDAETNSTTGLDSFSVTKTIFNLWGLN